MKPTSKKVIDELSKIFNATPKNINRTFMTPKEKAKELFQKMRIHSPVWEIEGDAKQCALIAVDEVIKCCQEYDEVHENHTTQVDYWKEVKREIKKL